MRLQRRILKAENAVDLLSEAFGVSENDIIEILEQELGGNFPAFDSCNETDVIIEELKLTFYTL